MDRFVVSARKYRPDDFNSVVGQQSITTTLKNSILNKQLGHAYLFSGPRGVGKTTCARIFAKTINCFNLTDGGEACNNCESCNSFNENRSYSIHELDAASNNSVDDIRTLTDQVRIPPQVGSYSIYIIDEVHMLSQQAFNAFLKTLEEPPKHAIFILATTEKHKIIPTILSRCQIYDFNRIKIEDIVNYLKVISGNEKVNFEEEALQIIAKKADGAMRDALSIFDQIVSFSTGNISYKSVIENLNILDYEYYFKITESLMNGDISSTLLLFNEILNRGFDARNFITGYAEHLRDLMVCKDPQTIQLMEVGAGIKERYLAQSAETGYGFLFEALDICNQADIHFRASKNQRLTIELALVKMAGLNGEQKKNLKPPAEKTGETVVEAADVKQTKEVQPENDIKISSTEKPENGTAVNRIVRKQPISIKESLKPKSSSDDLNMDDDKDQIIESEPDAMSLEEPDPESLVIAWNDYAKSVEKSNRRIYSTLTAHQPVVKSDGSLTVKLNTQAQRDNFINYIRPRLISYFIKSLGQREYRIEATVAAENAERNRIYTDQDKLDFMISRNPELKKFKTSFNLDFDE